MLTNPHSIGADPVYMDLKELFHSIMFLANETPNNLVNLEYMPNLSKKNTKMAGFALSRIYFNSGEPDNPFLPPYYAKLTHTFE